MKENMFKDSAFVKKLVHLAAPIAFQNLMLAAVAAADALMLGNLNQNAMAAVSLATQIQFVQNIILSSIVSVCTILGAQYWGKKDVKTLGDVFGKALRIASIASVIFFIGCTFFSSEMMRLFASDPELIQIGAEYLQIAGWSYLLTGVSQCYYAMFKLTGNAGLTAKISALSVVMNIGLNAVLIFGLLGMPAMGVAGAAAATLISRCVELLCCIVFARSNRTPGLDVTRIFHRNAMIEKDYWKCLLPLLGAGLFWGVGFSAYSAFMGHLGADAAAANSVASVVRDLVCCLCNGIGYGGGILLGNELGAGKLDVGRLYGERLVRLSYICGFFSVLIMLMLTPIIVGMVKLSDGAQSYLMGMMIIMSVYMIGRAINTIIINGVFAAGGDTIFDMYSLAVCMWCLAVPLAALGTFVFHWSPLIVYACTCLDEVGKIPWVIYHFKKYKWVKDLTREIPEKVV